MSFDDPAVAMAVLVGTLRRLHTRSPKQVDGEHWCLHCAKGWDGEDFDRITYPCATIRAVDAISPTLELDSDFDRYARLDWVVTEADDYGALHAPISSHPAADGGETVTGVIACTPGAPTDMEIPGVFTRLSAPRCPNCCAATGLPSGDGSPKNDDECRRILGIHTDGTPNNQKATP